jgi:hypothetical protein
MWVMGDISYVSELGHEVCVAKAQIPKNSHVKADVRCVSFWFVVECRNDDER